MNRGKEKKTLQRNILMEWSVAPSIFNIKAHGLAHFLYWMKLSNYGVYEVYFNLLLEFDAIIIVVQENNFVVVVFNFFQYYQSDTAASTTHYHQQSIPYCFPSFSSLILLILLSYSM